MSLEFYSQDDTLIEAQNNLHYLELDPVSPRLLATFEMNEYRLLTIWVEACRRQGLSVGHYYDDTLLKYADLTLAIALLEQCYRQLANRSLLQVDLETPDNPYRKMYCLLQQAIDEARGVIGLCD